MTEAAAKIILIPKGAVVVGDRLFLIRCRECGQLLCRVYPGGCRYLYLDLLCKCGANPYVVLGDRRVWNGKAVPGRLYHSGRAFLCQACTVPLFAVFDRVRNFAFQAVCQCGKQYDRRLDLD